MKREASYFRSVLEQYLSGHHPEMGDCDSFLCGRSEKALGVYAEALKNGASYPEAEELANEVLYKGLHFSAYDMIVEVLWNEFSEEIPQGVAERLAAILLGNKAIAKVIGAYRPDDDFDSRPEYDQLYTELTGIIQLVMEKNELPAFGAARH